jgi:hypothetical protein
VDVRQQQRARHLAVERAQQRRDAGRGSRIDQHVADLPTADHAIAAEVVEVYRTHVLTAIPHTIASVPLAEFKLDFSITTHFLGDSGQRTGFLLLAGFLCSWVFIRTSARLMRSPKVPWWPGSVETKSGLHIHHLVWGIVTVLVTGFLGFSLQPPSPWLEILAVLFGVGMGLTLDEFALWLHLQDVYWSQQGRQSVDAVVITMTLGALVVVGVSPLDVGDAGSTVSIAVAVAIQVFIAGLCILKGKIVTGLAGLFFTPVAIVGAIRLAKPGSPWARRRYREGSKKLARAQQRHGRSQARRDRAMDLIGGTPSPDA